MPSFAFGLRRKPPSSPSSSSSSPRPPVVCRVVAGPAAEVAPCYGYAFGNPGLDAGVDQSLPVGAGALHDFDQDSEASLGHHDFCEETSLCGGARVFEVEGVDEDWAFYEKLEGGGGVYGGGEIVRRLVLALEEADKAKEGGDQYLSFHPFLGVHDDGDGEGAELWQDDVVDDVETETGNDSCVIRAVPDTQEKVGRVVVGHLNSHSVNSGWEADGKEIDATSPILPTFSRQANTTATPVRGLTLSKLTSHSSPLPSPKAIKMLSPAPPAMPTTAPRPASQPLRQPLADPPHRSPSDDAHPARAPSFSVKAQPLPPPSLVRRGRVRPRAAARASTFASTLCPAPPPENYTRKKGDGLISRSADLTRYIASEEDFFNSHMPVDPGIYFGDDFPPIKGGLPKLYSSSGRINLAALRRLKSGISGAEAQRCNGDHDDMEDMCDDMPSLRLSGRVKVRGLLGRVKGWGHGKV